MIDSFTLANQVTTRVEGVPIRIGLDTGTPLAMLLAEVISNSCKHAFPHGRKGEISIVITECSGEVRLRVSDNGVGLGTNPERRGPRSGMGHRLIGKFVEQLNGTACYPEGEGTSFELSFPRMVAEERGSQTACSTIERAIGACISNQDAS
jgi:two-component sensor histidine kinase